MEIDHRHTRALTTIADLIAERNELIGLAVNLQARIGKLEQQLEMKEGKDGKKENTDDGNSNVHTIETLKP